MTRINLISLVIFAAILLWALTLDREAVDGVQGRVHSALTPFMRASTALQEKVEEIGEDRTTYADLQDEVRKLRAEVAELRIENQLLQKLREENEGFRKALKLQQTSLFDLVSSRIVSRLTSTWFSTLDIDKGYDQEVSPDSPVVTPVLSDVGLVGKTIRVSRDQTTVILLTDEKCQVAAKVEGSREQGICMGQRGATERTPYLKLKFLTKEANLRPGTRVYSSGVGELFPSNLLLGTVKEFTPGDVYGEATVEPAVDFSELEHVFVIVGMR